MDIQKKVKFAAGNGVVEDEEFDMDVLRYEEEAKEKEEELLEREVRENGGAEEEEEEAECKIDEDTVSEKEEAEAENGKSQQKGEDMGHSQK